MNQSLVTLMNNLPEGVDAAIITSDENRRYFTNMKSSAGTLVVTKNKPCFIIDFRYIEKARTVITDFDVILQEINIFSQIDAILKENNVKTVAIESASMTVSQYQRFCEKLQDYEFTKSNALSNFISDLRAIKSEEEIEFITKAQEITDKAFLHILDYIKPGMTELEIQLELEYTMKKLGASNIAFDSIVVSGANSSLPHGVPSAKKVEQGDFITMDFGAAYNGYCSDMTRTVAIGKISDEQKKVYDTVLTAQLMAIDAIRAGKKYSDIDKIARDYIDSQGYQGCFGHGLGHSLGLNIHEEPRFGSTCDEITKVNTVMTVEPGIYLSGKFGVRIEDMVIIQENGCINITKSAKKLITL
jgi:Xaa-Pro aminopeptidase